MTDGPTTPPPAAPPPGSPVSLPERVKNIIVDPKAEWARIEREPATVAGLFTGYAMILAAIGPVAQVIGGVLFGAPMGFVIAQALVAYLLSLASVFIVALIIDALAPSFGGTKDQVQATKAAVYSATPGWLVGVLAILPQLAALVGLVALLALAYGIYLLYLGLPRLMRVAEDKAVGYVVVTAIAWIVVWVVLAMFLTGALLSAFGFGMMTGLGRY